MSDGDPRHAGADDDDSRIPPLGRGGHGRTVCPPKVPRQELWPIVIVVVPQEFLGVVVGVGAGLAVVEMRRRGPFGLAAMVLAGGPALFGEFVVGAAAKSQVVDVGDRVYGVAVAVVDFAEIARDVA